jgi:hypothetical protein
MRVRWRVRSWCTCEGASPVHSFLGPGGDAVGVAQPRARRLEGGIRERQVHVQRTEEDREIRRRRKVPSKARIEVADVISGGVIDGRAGVID